MTTGQKELPVGWKWVKLKDVCEVTGGFAFKSNSYRYSGVPIIRIGDIQLGRVLISGSTKFVDQTTVRDLERYKLSVGNVLIALSGATTGKIGIVDESILPAYLNQRVGRFEPKANLDIIYLRNFLSQPGYIERIFEITRVSKYIHITKSDADAIKFILEKKWKTS